MTDEQKEMLKDGLINKGWAVYCKDKEQAFEFATNVEYIFGNSTNGPTTFANYIRRYCNAWEYFFIKQTNHGFRFDAAHSSIAALGVAKEVKSWDELSQSIESYMPVMESWLPTIAIEENEYFEILTEGVN